jgi:hypothetical protein
MAPRQLKKGMVIALGVNEHKYMNRDFQKYFLILGGFIGFCSTLVVGIYGAQEPLINLLHATGGCVAGFFATKLLIFVMRLHWISHKEETQPPSTTQQQENNL